MDLKQLQDAGGFVEVEPVMVAVEWVKPAAGDAAAETVKFDVWIRRRSFGMVSRIMEGSAIDRARSAEMISASVLLGEKRESMTYDQAYQLHPSLAHALIDAVNKASAPKNSQPPTSSGTN